MTNLPILNIHKFVLYYTYRETNKPIFNITLFSMEQNKFRMREVILYVKNHMSVVNCFKRLSFSKLSIQVNRVKAQM